MGSMDRYTLVRLLGKGASGAVYLVEDRLKNNRKIALKRINIGIDELLQAAFEREFATMASLSLPGVARVFDFGVAEKDGDQVGGPFFTRSFIDGSPLDLAVESLTPRKRVQLVAQVAQIVAPLHRVGVIHGDLKPGNVIVDPEGRAHVIDFGLARIVADRGRPESTGGTPSFMAPELLQGEPSSVQGDIYALGVTLWIVLTGNDPFSALGRSAIRVKLDGKAPGLPADRDPITTAALKVALKAIAFNPLDRFPTADELLISLDRIAPPEYDRNTSRGFVPPRPRGHEAALSALESRINKTTDSAAAIKASEALIVAAPSGGGKSTFLRELKWRLQIRSFHVIEIAVRAGDMLAPLL
jgi:serine/threonine protein kinase